MTALAIRTGIPFEVWRDCDDPRVVATAFALLHEEDRKARQQGGPQMSG